MSLFGFGKQRSAKETQPRLVKALLFDVFGTTVDWLGGMTALGERLGAERGIHADWHGLAKEWRSRYPSALKPVREGKRPWTGFDMLHREQLDNIIVKFGKAQKLSSSDRDVFTHGWSFLDPWPDAIPALDRLRKHFILGPLSNATTRQLIDLARWGNLPWDVVFGGDVFRTYKPDKKVYLGAAALLGLQPSEILMVAAHTQDLDAARSNGLKTCFVRRSTEDPEPVSTYDYVVDDLEQLARTLIAV